MSFKSQLTFRIKCIVPRAVRKIMGSLISKLKNGKLSEIEEKLDDIRNIIIFNHPIDNVPQATGSLRLLHDANSVLLKMFAKKCDEHNLRYWLDYGTLMGCVRHKGFIPWDDDIDIGMMRSDYEKFVELAPQFFPEEEGFFFKHHIFFQIGYKDTPINIDVFPYHFHAVSLTEENDALIDAKITKLKNKCVWHDGHINYTDAQIQEMIKTHVLDGLSPLPESESPAIFVNPAVTFTKNFNLAYDTVFPLKKAQFEGMECTVPNKSRQYLQQIFGNYMCYPPHVGFQHKHLEAMIKRHKCISLMNKFIDTYGI